MLTPALASLIAACIFWLAIHLVIASSPLRWVLVGRIGDKGFRGVFSLLSLVGLVWLGWSYGEAEMPDSFYGLRLVEHWMLWAPFVAMPLALLLFVGSVTQPNPTAVGGEAILNSPMPAVAVLRITRHPMLWAFALWAIAHLIAKGDLASLLFFGSVLLVALNGMVSIDRKRARQDPEAWQRFAAETSVVPFAAIVAGRNQLVFGEIGLWRFAVALVAWVALLVLHPLVFGVQAFPG